MNRTSIKNADTTYLDDSQAVLARVGWLLRWAKRLTRMAPRIRTEDRRRDCLQMIDVFLDRAEDLVRHLIDSLPVIATISERGLK